MTADDFARVKKLLIEILDLPATERRAYLDKTCRDNPSLRAEVESILAHDEDEIRTFAATGIPPAKKHELPKEIAGYRILESLGEGGMGEVYLAEQTSPVRRRVALKVIKAGMDTKQVVARFEAERQALAMMDHPNIARVYDAGATEDGRPFFAMEHVPGEKITAYCDRRRLPTRERLRLFIQTCEAVQHAHQRGIIHRDLKPMNVLVEEIDGRPLPKVIDFGIAKATAQPLTERTLHTEQGQIIGTPEYMSPEQADPGTLDVDTRTDIYSLGVVLYELLVGSLPFDSRTLREAGYAGMQRILREEDPPRPSTRLQTPGSDTEAIARNRDVERSTLLGQLRGDLDWIVMKALEKDRNRRYASASEFAADIDRYLANEPVLARPPSVTYQLAKLAARHRTPFVFAAVLFLLVTASAITTAVLYRNQRTARAQAVDEARRTERMNAFLQDMLASVSPEVAQGRDVSVRYILDEAAGKIDAEFADDSEIRASLHATLGHTYQELDLREPAELQLWTALTLRRERQESDPAALIGALNDWAWFLHASDKDSAEIVAREAVALGRPLVDRGHAEVGRSLNILADLRKHEEDFEQSKELFDEALTVQRRLLGADDPAVAETLNDLGLLLLKMEDFDAAESTLRESIRIWRNLFGENHPQVLNSMANLGDVLRLRGDYGEAEVLYRDVLDRQRQVLGESRTMARLLDLAALLKLKGDPDGVIAIQREIVELRRKTDGGDHPQVALDLHGLATSLQKRGGASDLEEAESLYLESLAIARANPAAERLGIQVTLSNLGFLQRRMGKYREAVDTSREALAMSRSLYEPDHQQVGIAMTGHGWALVSAGEPAQGVTLLRQALEIFGAKLPENHFWIGRTRNALGAGLTSLGEYAEAERELLAAYEILQSPGNETARGPRVANLEYLVELHQAWGKPARAAEYRAELGSLNAEIESEKEKM